MSGIDFWGDFGQIGAALGGFATLAVAGFGAAVFVATNRLTDQTRALAEATRQATEHDKQIASKEDYLRSRPALSVWIEHHDQGQGDLATLYARHLGSSHTSVIDSLALVIVDAADTVPLANGELRGPWRLSFGSNNADKFGRTADPRTDLRRGILTQWALTQQTSRIGLKKDPWLDDSGHPNPCLIEFRATAGEHSWDYSALVTGPGAEVTL